MGWGSKIFNFASSNLWEKPKTISKTLIISWRNISGNKAKFSECIILSKLIKLFIIYFPLKKERRQRCQKIPYSFLCLSKKFKWIHWYSWDKTFDNLLYFRGNQIKLLLVFFYYSWRVASDKEFFHYFNVTILETYGFVI